MVKEQGYDGMYRLVTDDGQDVNLNDGYKDFRGDGVILFAARAPHNENSSGSVFVKRNKNDSDFATTKYYPEVLNMKWIKDNG